MTLLRCNFATRFHHPEVQLCNVHPYHDTAEVQLCDTHSSSCHQRGSTLRLASDIITLWECNFATCIHHRDTAKVQLCDTRPSEVQLCDQHQSSCHQGGATLRRASTIMTTRRCNFATRINSYDATLRCASINKTPGGATFCNAHPSS
jgi:hypothetical protein